MTERVLWKGFAGLLLLAALARVGTSMTSPSNELRRNVVNSGGKRSTSANNTLVGNAGEPVAGQPAASANSKLRAGWSHLQSFPGLISNLSAAADVTSSSFTLNWTTPGYDGP